MIATDQRLVGGCAIEEGHPRLSCQWHVHVEPERPFRMQEADRRVDHDVAGEEHFFAAGTDMHRDVAWRCGFSVGDTLPASSGALQRATSVSLATNSTEGNSSYAFLPSLIPHRWSKWP